MKVSSRERRAGACQGGLLWQELTLRAHSANNICETACCEMYFKVPPKRFMAARHAYVSLPDGLQGVVMGQSEPFTFSLIPPSRPGLPDLSRD